MWHYIVTLYLLINNNDSKRYTLMLIININDNNRCTLQLFVWGDHRAHIVRHVPAPADRSLWRMTADMSGEVRCVCNYPAIVSLTILNLYWDSLLFRGGPKFSLRNICKRVVKRQTQRSPYT